jgi:chemotaxis protein CheX
MDVKLINPFINSAMNVITTMAFTEVTPGKPHIKTDKTTYGAVTGIIGLASDVYSGNMILSFEEKAILSIVSKMLGEEFPEVTKDVVDAVGELTNMISGGAKAELSQEGFVFDMATPAMISGKGVDISQLTSVPTIVIPFSTEAGGFVVEASVQKKG